MVIRFYEKFTGSGAGESSRMICTIDGTVSPCDIATNTDGNVYELLTYYIGSDFNNQFSISSCDAANEYYFSVTYEKIRDEGETEETLAKVSAATVSFSLFSSILFAYLIFKRSSGTRY